MFEITNAKIWLENNIIFCKYADKTDIDLEIAKQCVKGRLKISNGKSYPTMIYLTGVKSVNKAARAYLSDEGIQLMTAGAFIVSSPLTKMLGNVFVKINQPKVPAKLFTDEKSAAEWLRSLL